MLAKVEYIKETDDYVLTLPDEVIESFDLKPGDKVCFEDMGNSTIKMTFPKEDKNGKK